MRITYLLFSILLLGLPLLSLAQTLVPQKITELSSEISETSGLININGKLFTHNDSGNGPVIFQIDPADGTVLRKVQIEGAINTDWEEITVDNEFVYIGDFGNNRGTRKDLRIYKISRSRLLTEDVVPAELITFSYQKQLSYSSDFFTNYDAEAFISDGDSLYIFSKNWGNSRTYIYSLPVVPGDYKLTVKDSLEAGGLITGSAWVAETGELLLTGYNFAEAFVWQVKGFNGRFTGKEARKNIIKDSGGLQLEAVCPDGNGDFFITNEASANPAKLQRISLNDVVTAAVLEEKASGKLQHCLINDLLSGIDGQRLRIINLQGQEVYNGDPTVYKIPGLAAGIYIMYITDSDNQLISSLKFVSE
jgi:hypothetical protein